MKDTTATPNTRSKRLGHAHTGREISLANLCTESGAIVVTSLLEPAPSIIHGVGGPRGGGGARGRLRELPPSRPNVARPSLSPASSSPVFIFTCLWSDNFEEELANWNECRKCFGLTKTVLGHLGLCFTLLAWVLCCKRNRYFVFWQNLMRGCNV